MNDIEFTTVIDQFGKGTAVPTVRSIYNAYSNGTIDKQQCVSFLHDRGIASINDLKKENAKWNQSTK